MRSIIVKTVSRILIPFIQLFALYTIMHGESGPGGGFQGGVILSASIIFYIIVFGIGEARKKFTERQNIFLISLGVMLYAGIGLLCIFFKGNFLEYKTLPFGTPQHSSELGILGVEIGIGITVFAVLTSIFFNMAGRQNHD